MIVVSSAVRAAMSERRPVVALESTLFSRLGLPPPAGAEALRRCTLAITRGGAVAALTAVLDGVARVGLDDAEIERVFSIERKVAERDLPVAMAQRWPGGATTVSATLALADASGIVVFATGGIGGVHRGAPSSGDVSADLDAIASHPVVTVCSGAKAFLDLTLTLEYLETKGVPVVGFGTDEFPAFYARSSGLPVPHRVDSAQEVSEIFLAAREVGNPGAILVAVPVPEQDAIPAGVLDRAIDAALEAAEAAAMTGPAVTPFVLEHLATMTEGRSIAANLSLAENNAKTAAEIAVCIASSTR